MIHKIRNYLNKIYYIFKLLVAWCYLHILKRSLLNKDIWLIREKKDEARDNGYHFFCYLKEKHPEINAYYAIKSNSFDFYKISKYENIIEVDSFKHCVYYLASKYSISSQPFGAFPFIFSNRELFWIKRLCNQNQKTVFLQHGIIQNALSIDFKYSQCNIDYFVCSARKEYEFVKELYEYPEKAIGLVGLARFDNLMKTDTEEKIILIMPTWRRWLSCMVNNVPTEIEKRNFLESDFYKAYIDILQDVEFIEYLRKKNYKIIFYLHYKLQGYAANFSFLNNDVIKIAEKEIYDVQELLIKSKLLITDYSSVHFDFAYMNKPLIYYQFDEERFNKFHFSKGYFSYRQDGFGPCCKEKDSLIKKIVELINEDTNQLYEYEKRVNNFFELRDKRNCERIYSAISDL